MTRFTWLLAKDDGSPAWALCATFKTLALAKAFTADTLIPCAYGPAESAWEENRAVFTPEQTAPYVEGQLFADLERAGASPEIAPAVDVEKISLKLLSGSSVPGLLTILGPFDVEALDAANAASLAGVTGGMDTLLGISGGN